MINEAENQTGWRSLHLANEVLGISSEGVTEKDREQLKRLVLDHLACTYRGAHLRLGQSLRRGALPYRRAGRAPIIGDTVRTSAPVAALVNATAAHGLELDDTHDESVSHPGASIIATAFTVATQYRISGAALFPAILAGYEVVGRLGAATNAARIIENGFHPTSLFTGFGAAATAAHLIGLRPEQLASAWGLLLSMAGGSMQFSQEAVGTDVKRLHGGYAALHGVFAAELAAGGVGGPLEALDGRYGLCAIFGENQDLSRLTTPHPDGPEIHRISFKPYPCCRLFHSTLDALALASDRFSTPPEDIAEIHVGGPEILVSQHMLRRPQSMMAAQYSLPFTLATAFFSGPGSVDGFTDDAMADPRILSLADTVSGELNTKMNDAFPEHFGSTVRLTHRDGSSREHEVLDSLGTPSNPMSRDALIRKFDELVEPVGGPRALPSRNVSNCLRNRTT